MINHTFKSYLEGLEVKINGKPMDRETIWLKPEFNCPLGYTLWVSSSIRKVSIVSRKEFMQEQRKLHYS